MVWEADLVAVKLRVDIAEADIWWEQHLASFSPDAFWEFKPLKIIQIWLWTSKFIKPDMNLSPSKFRSPLCWALYSYLLPIQAWHCSSWQRKVFPFMRPDADDYNGGQYWNMWKRVSQQTTSLRNTHLSPCPPITVPPWHSLHGIHII